MFDVITVGSATVDVFADTDSELIKIKTPHTEEELIAYPVGSKLIVRQLDFFIGGGGTNTAVAFSRLGLKTAYLGKLGKDENSEMILKVLKKEKVDFIGNRSNGMSGYSVILDSLEHERTILAYKGLNDDFRFTDADMQKLNAKLYYMSSMLDGAFHACEEVAKHAKDQGAKVAFNPSNYLAKMGKAYLRRLLESCDYLILNKEEAGLIVGDGSIEHLLTELALLGPEIVVVTNGRDGSYAYDMKNMYHVKPYGFKPLEPTGAGDAFASSFVAGLLKGKTLQFALRVGQVNAESIILHKGAKERLLTWKEVLAQIRKRPPKIRKRALKPKSP